MFSKLTLFAVASMAVFVAADIHDSCNTGKVQCCNSFQSSNTPGFSQIFSIIGVSLKDVTGQVGFDCSPITVIGTGSGSSCTSQPVCCSNNSFNGVVAIGCSPVNIGL